MVLSLTIETRVRCISVSQSRVHTWKFGTIRHVFSLSRRCTFSQPLRLSRGIISGYSRNGRVLNQDPISWKHYGCGDPSIDQYNGLSSNPLADFLWAHGWFCSQPGKKTGVGSF